jgi:hypothetical protein
MELARCAICGEEHPLAEMVTRHNEPEDVPNDARATFPAPHDWWLEDAEAAQERHPRSFFIPAAERRRALRPGELVRLGFDYGPHADREGEGHRERMWVEVLDQRDDGHAHGRLRNHPWRLSELDLGDQVAFEPMNVLAIDYTDEELGYAQDQWPVVDEAILAEDRAPDVVVRAPGPYTADHDEWWLLCRSGGTGPTSEGVARLTDLFPGLEEPLRAGAGVWELAEGERASARWRCVPEGELTGEEWQRLLRWLDETAQAMRKA